MGMNIYTREGRLKDGGGTGGETDSNFIGAIITSSRRTIPAGYALANGASYTRAQFPEAYNVAVEEAAAGNTLWTVNTVAQTFTVPNLSDKFLLASGTRATGVTGGAETVLLTAAQSGLRDHSHSYSRAINIGFQHAAGGNTAYYHTYDSPQTGGSGNVNATSSHENMPPYIVVAQLVKIYHAKTPVQPEAWHIVGATGEPAFTNSWAVSNLGPPPSFRKGVDGQVYLRGTAQTGVADTSAFTLPSGYRPTHRLDLPVIGNNAPARMVVNTDGTVLLPNSTWTNFQQQFWTT